MSMFTPKTPDLSRESSEDGYLASAMPTTQPRKKNPHRIVKENQPRAHLRFAEILTAIAVSELRCACHQFTPESSRGQSRP